MPALIFVANVTKNFHFTSEALMKSVTISEGICGRKNQERAVRVVQKK